MPYIVQRGNVIGDEGAIYEIGEAVPGKRGELADMEEAGSVRWVSAGEAKKLIKETETDNPQGDQADQQPEESE